MFTFVERLLADRGIKIQEAFKDLKEVTSGDWMSEVRRNHSGVKIDTDSKNKNPDLRGRLIAISNNKQVGYFDDKSGRCSVTMKDGTSIGKPIKGFKEGMLSSYYPTP